MIGERDNDDDIEEVDDDGLDGDEDTLVIDSTDDDDDDDDNVGDLSVELNVEELVAKLEATDSDDLVRRRQIKRRLEELWEQKQVERDLDSTYNFDFDDDD